MDNKAPGTNPRVGGYHGAAGASEAAEETAFFTPRQRVDTSSVQRASLRIGRRVGFALTFISFVVIILPTYIGPLYVKYCAQKNWLERASKTIWQRRNEKDHEAYLSQRKNGWLQWLGLQRYNIGGEENDAEIHKYR